MANLLYLKVLIITSIIQSITTSQTQIYPLFSPKNPTDQIDEKELNIKELNKLVTIKPALLRASSLNSLLKKSHLNLFNKPSSIAFLKVKNKKYLPQLDFLFTSSSSKNKIPNYQLATPIKSLLGGSALIASNDQLNQLNRFNQLNLKSIGNSKIKFMNSKSFVTKPLFVPIQNSLNDNNLKKFNTWNNFLTTYSNQLNNQLIADTVNKQTSLPVFVYSDSKSNLNSNLNSNSNNLNGNYNQNKFNNDKNILQQQPSNGQQFKQRSPSSNFQSNSYSNSMKSNNEIKNQYKNNVNQMNQTTMMKSVNYSKQTNFNTGSRQTPQFSNDFKPIVSSNSNSFRSGRTIAFDKGQYRQSSNEVKSSEQQSINYSNTKMRPTNEILNNMDLERNILNTIEKDIELKNFKFVKSIVLPKKQFNHFGEQKISNKKTEKNDQKILTNHLNSMNQYNQFNNNQNNYRQQNIVENSSRLNNHSNGNLQTNNIRNNEYPANQNYKPPSQPIQQQSVQHFLKTQSSSINQMNSYDKSSEKSSNNNKDSGRSEKNNRPIKMPKFKVIRYKDQGAIEEFTKALENIEFKSISQSDLGDLPDFVYNKLNEAKIETVIGSKENSNYQSSNQQNAEPKGSSINGYSNNKNDQKPPLQYFTANDCAKNRKMMQNQMNNGQQQGYQSNDQSNNGQNNQANYQQQNNQQQNNNQQNYQQQSNNQQNNNQQNYQQSNNQQQQSYQSQQGSSSQQKSSYFNDPQSNSINSLVKFDDQANFYSTASTKLRQLKVLPTFELSTIQNDGQFNSKSNHQSMDSGNLNKNNESNEWTKKEINDNVSSDQFNNNLKTTDRSDQNDRNEQIDKKQITSDIESELDDETVTDQLDSVTNKKQKTSISTETDSLDPTKLDLKIIHLPVSVFKKLISKNEMVQPENEGSKKKK